MSGKKPKRSSKNLKINTRIVLTTVLAIAIPLVLVALVCLGLLHSTSHTFQLAAETADRYSLVNQIGWNQTVSNLSDVLLRTKDTDAEKLADIAAYAAPLEKRGVALEIRRGDEVFYRSAGCKDVLGRARQIVAFDSEKNVYHFGQDGLVIVSHVQAGGQRCSLVLTGTGYTVADQTEPAARGTLSRLLMGRTGLVVLAIVLIFAAAVAAFSFFTSRTIVRPIQKIARGADAIAGGNLDYQIDYDSTNELGQTVESFNAMRLRLKETIESREKSEQLRREMTAGFAHDLRTPLTSIKGYAEGLRDGIANTPEKQQRYLQTIYDSAVQTEKILDDLLALSKLELGSTGNDRSIVQLQAVLDDAAPELTAFMENRGCTFALENHCPADTQIEIDTDAFRRVFLNILGNAVKYARPGVPGRLALTATAYDRVVILEFADNGIGVDKDQLRKIFDAMYRTDPARSQVSQGSGLGLAVCKQIVEQNGGSIWARSHTDAGLSIFISLPKRERVADEADIDY